MKKIIMILMTVILVTTLVAGCAPQKTPSGNPSNVAPGTTTPENTTTPGTTAPDTTTTPGTTTPGTENPGGTETPGAGTSGSLEIWWNV